MLRGFAEERAARARRITARNCELGKSARQKEGGFFDKMSTVSGIVSTTSAWKRVLYAANLEDA